MPQCKECGTNLPEDARFCLNCGAPVQPEVPDVPPSGPPTPPPDLDFVRPALTGGAFLGILSSMPIVAAGNCLCCMWVLGGGAIATNLLSKQQPGRRLSYGDGAFAGVSSGLFGAMIATLISIPLKILSAPFLESQRQQMEKAFSEFPGLLELFNRMTSPDITAVTVTVTFITNLVMYSLFAMIGGILMVAYLERQAGNRART